MDLFDDENEIPLLALPLHLFIRIEARATGKRMIR